MKVDEKPIRLVSSQASTANGHSTFDPFENWLEPWFTGEGLGDCDAIRPLGTLSRVNGTWLESLSWSKVTTGKGHDAVSYYVPKSCHTNALTIFTHDPRWVGVLSFDEFSQEIRALKSPPFHAVERCGYKLGSWTENDTVRALSWLHRVYGIKLGVETVYQAISVAAEGMKVHPVRDWLKSLEWDGVKRLENWLIYYFAADDSVYTRAVSKCFLISLVARAMRPGCKLDTMPVFEGAQGILKSTALRTLVGDSWFVELSGAIDPKDTPQLLRGKWLAEFSELSAFKRTKDVELIKGFLSRPFDTYRAPYDRRAKDYPRQTVFAGSTNEEHYLKDATGARRFWPIRMNGRVNLQGLEVDRKQLFAEALLEFEAGEPWWLSTPELTSQAQLVQSERYDDDAWTSHIESWISTPLRKLEGVTTEEALTDCLEVELSRHTNADFTRVGTIFRRLGWQPRGRTRPRRYYPPDATI